MLEDDFMGSLGHEEFFSDYYFKIFCFRKIGPAQVLRLFPVSLGHDYLWNGVLKVRAGLLDRIRQKALNLVI